jgi:hypothetical protein
LLRSEPTVYIGPKKCIITFIGPVGVGKSTQIDLLKINLRSRNIKVVETFIKSTHALAYILSRLLIGLVECEKVRFSDGTTHVYPRKEIMKKLFSLWCFLDAISITAKFFFAVCIPFYLGFTLLVEEGLMMTQLTYRKVFPFFFETESKVPPLVTTLLGWVMSNNHANFVLDATEDDLKIRRRKRLYRQNELPVYTSMQKSWMEHLNSSNTFFINTSGKTAREVHKKIVVALEENTRALSN